MCFWKRHREYDQLISGRIKELTTINELSTTEYTIVKVVKAEDMPKINLGDRKILYSCKIYLKAGINMDMYDPSKTELNEIEKKATIILPHATLLSFNMPAEEQRLEYIKVDVLRKRISQRERNDLLIQGEEIVRKQIEDIGIIKDAERNARDIFSVALSQLGFQKIDIKFE